MGPAFGVLGQQAPHQRGKVAGQAVFSHHRDHAAKLELGAQDGVVVAAGERPLTGRQRDQGDAEGIEVVGEGAITPTGRKTGGGGNVLEHGRLREAGRGAEPVAEHDGTALRAEQVVRADAAMGQAKLGEGKQGACNGSDDVLDQVALAHGLGPRAGAHQGRPRRRLVDDGADSGPAPDHDVLAEGPDEARQIRLVDQPLQGAQPGRMLVAAQHGNRLPAVRRPWRGSMPSRRGRSRPSGLGDRP
ncbi:MAG: hypothetical protein RML45_05855 [Acetobacteraceae bacterium]|nr:hypothetical protein [Acetobacteraceae bacterium]